MVLDWIPVVSQLKSLVQVIAGDEEGARRTQENFSRQCPGISQLRSAGQLVTGDVDGAVETQWAFVRNVADVTDVMPVVSQGKSLLQAVAGNEEGARQTQENFSRRCPGVSQMRSAVESLSGDDRAAEATQLEFIRHLGIPHPEKKNLYHYTNRRGKRAIEREKKITASRDENGDAAFGEGVYLTSLDPRHFSSDEVLHNNYDDIKGYFADRADYVVEVWIPRDEINRVPDKRDIYLYNGDLYLDDYEHNIFRN